MSSPDARTPRAAGGDAAASEVAPTPVPARFVLGERVARGSSGEVLSGLDRETGEHVAVKRVHAFLAGPEATRRFEREAALLARVASPYVVRCLAHGVDDDGRATLVLAWIDGEDLASRLARGPATLAEAREIARQAALGLAALHEAGIVHGDVKPSNFLVATGADGAPRVRLVDLGFAHTTGGAEPDAPGLVAGTPSRFSPEQARGDAHVGPASDQFSLGVVLYELVTGARPFDAREPLAALAAIALAEPPPVRALRPDAPAALEAIVARALAKEPEVRFPSTAAFAAALGALDATATAGDAAGPPTEAPEEREISAIFAAFPAHHAGSVEGGWRRDAAAEAERAPAGVPRGLEALRAIVAAHDGVTRPMLGGRAIALFGPGPRGGDDARHAARAALAAAALPGAHLALASGAAARGGTGLSVELAERGATALAHARPGAVRVDEETARRLAPRLLVDEADGALVLRAERRADEAGVD